VNQSNNEIDPNEIKKQLLGSTTGFFIDKQTWRPAMLGAMVEEMKKSPDAHLQPFDLDSTHIRHK